MAQGSVQLWPPVTMNGLIQTLIYRLATHPLIVNPPIWDETGQAIRITKFRNFDGLELKNPAGITLSVFPFHYANTDASTNLTTESTNASVVFREHTLGGGQGLDVTAIDEANANIMLKLHAFGIKQTTEADPEIIGGQNTQFEYNYVEWGLRQYAELIAQVLRSKEIRKLPRFYDQRQMVSNSFVKYVDFPTARWDQGGNLVLHSATILWQTKYYAVREWKVTPNYVPAEMAGSTLIVGTASIGGIDTDVYYDTLNGLFIKDDGTVLDTTLLTDPTTGSPYSTLDTDLMTLISTAPSGTFDFSYYFKRVGDT